MLVDAPPKYSVLMGSAERQLQLGCPPPRLASFVLRVTGSSWLQAVRKLRNPHSACSPLGFQPPGRSTSGPPLPTRAPQAQICSVCQVSSTVERAPRRPSHTHGGRPVGGLALPCMRSFFLSPQYRTLVRPASSFWLARRTPRRGRLRAAIHSTHGFKAPWRPFRSTTRLAIVNGSCNPLIRQVLVPW